MRHYKATLSQSGTNAPTANVFVNTLVGTPVFARTAQGTYTMTLAGAFPDGKVFIEPRFASNEVWDFSFYAERTDDNTITFYSCSDDGGQFDDKLSDFPFTVLVKH